MSSLQQRSPPSEKSLEGFESSSLHERAHNGSDDTLSEKEEIDRSDSRDIEHNGASSSRPPLRPRLERTRSNVLERVGSRLSTFSIRDPGPPPDGGLKAWTMVGMAWLTVFSAWGYANSFGAFQTYYESTMDVSPSTISWIGSVQVWILFFLGAISGRALDAGLFLPTFMVGVVIQLIGIFSMSFSTKYWQIFLTQAVCTGVGGGIFFTPALAIVPTYFSKHRGIAVAIASTGNSAGGMIYPTIVRQLLPQIGFGWTVRVLGFMNLACLVVVLCFMRPRLPPRKAGPIFDISAFKEPPYAYFVAGIFFVTWALYFTVYYLASYGRDISGLSYSDSVMLLIILNGIGIPARAITGYVADSFFGAFNTFVPILFLNTIFLYYWLAVKDVNSVYVFTCLYGLACAAFQSLFPTTIAQLSDDHSKLGTRLGMAFSVMAFAGLTGPPLGGALLTTDHGGYLPAQIWVGTATLVGTLLIAASRVNKYGWSWKVKC